jgi:hypothetical protein
MYKTGKILQGVILGLVLLLAWMTIGRSSGYYDGPETGGAPIPPAVPLNQAPPAGPLSMSGPPSMSGPVPMYGGAMPMSGGGTMVPMMPMRASGGPVPMYGGVPMTGSTAPFPFMAPAPSTSKKICIDI